jgi:chromosome segregation ATPase
LIANLTMAVSPEQNRLEVRLDRIDDQLSDLARFTLESAQREERARIEFRRDIAEFKDGMTEFKDGMTELKEGMTELKEGMTELKGSMTELKEGMTEFRASLEVTNTRLDRIEATTEQQTANVDRLVRIVEILLPDRQSL